MNKKQRRKHHKTCMHCAFLLAFRTKYDTPKKRQEKKAFNDMVRSAIKITAMVFSKIDMESQRQFLVEVAEQSGMFEQIRAARAQEPTKH